jgi:hypothetical protein
VVYASHMRALLCMLALGAAVLVAALPAAGKEGVKATLTTRVPVSAPAGTMVRIGWTLGYRDAHGRLHPFGGRGIFVRLLGHPGVPAHTAFAHGTTGGYAATVRVPQGGLRGIQIGIRGWSNGPTGTHRADMLFPITNNPFRR